MIASRDIHNMNEALDRCDGYTTLGMLEEAREELRSVHDELRSTFPFMATCMNMCLKFEWWEEGAELGRQLLARWPENEEVRLATARCLLKSGHEIDGVMLMRGIEPRRQGGRQYPGRSSRFE